MITDDGGYTYGPTLTELRQAHAAGSPIHVQRYDGEWVDPVQPVTDPHFPAPADVPLWHYRVGPVPPRVPQPGERWAILPGYGRGVDILAVHPHGQDVYCWVLTGMGPGNAHVWTETARWSPGNAHSWSILSDNDTSTEGTDQ